MKKILYVNIIMMNAMIACIYAILTIMISPIAYGAIQMRMSEILVLLACDSKKYIPGLVIGCFIANMASPMGLWDMLFGTLATLLTCIAINKVSLLYLTAFIGAIINGIIVGLELYSILQLPFFINFIYIFIGEFIVLIIGVFLFKILEKNHGFMEKYIL